MDGFVPKCSSELNEQGSPRGWDLRLAEGKRSHLDLHIHANPLSKTPARKHSHRMTKDPLGESSLVISPAVHPQGLLFKR